MAVRSAWTLSGRLSSELYAICSRSVAGWPRATTSPSSMVVDARAGGCKCGRNASLGEPAAYQASLHHFSVDTAQAVPGAMPPCLARLELA